MMPNEPLRDVMRRTMKNLEFVERSATPTGPFEVTQLINSFIGALAHPWEQLKAELNDMPLSDAAGWPIITKELPSDADPDSIVSGVLRSPSRSCRDLRVCGLVQPLGLEWTQCIMLSRSRRAAWFHRRGPSAFV